MDKRKAVKQKLAKQKRCVSTSSSSSDDSNNVRPISASDESDPETFSNLEPDGFHDEHDLSENENEIEDELAEPNLPVINVYDYVVV